jgi:hypothetical protein
MTGKGKECAVLFPQFSAVQSAGRTAKGYSEVTREHREERWDLGSWGCPGISSQLWTACLWICFTLQKKQATVLFWVFVVMHR